MRKIVYSCLSFFSRLIDYLALLFLFVLVSFGLYGLWDVQQIYDAAEPKNYIAYKPGKKSQEPDYGYEALRKKNEELVGWLEIFGTSIDYPIMQAKDNVRYLTTDPLGGYSAAGSVFLDARNQSDFSESLVILYGHHMAHHAMFGDLGNFAEESFFDSHLYGDLYVSGRHYGLRILAYLRTEADDRELYRFTFEGEDWRSYFSHLKELAIHDRFSLLSEREGKKAQLVILSTCTEETEGRQIVVAERRQEIFANPFAEDNSVLPGVEEKMNFGPWVIWIILITLFLILLVFYGYSKHKLRIIQEGIRNENTEVNRE